MLKLGEIRAENGRIRAENGGVRPEITDDLNDMSPFLVSIVVLCKPYFCVRLQNFDI